MRRKLRKCCKNGERCNHSYQLACCNLYLAINLGSPMSKQTIVMFSSLLSQYNYVELGNVAAIHMAYCIGSPMSGGTELVGSPTLFKNNLRCTLIFTSKMLNAMIIAKRRQVCSEGGLLDGPNVTLSEVVFACPFHFGKCGLFFTPNPDIRIFVQIGIGPYTLFSNCK